ncbi:MAG: NADH:ubiquinone oxidoreductase subunit NDUFA12 [Bauldia sp.]|nr:NADH:ubiquinone oxidoreductase subunit NDUFA12 [Bauldia sp.]
MKQFILQFFTWWNGQTLGTRFHTWRRGKLVGTDEAGNRYYRDPRNDRRWVIYNGVAEASAIPPGWHAWMHRTTDTAPPDSNYRRRSWEKPHQPNLTGTPRAYRPPGSILNPAERPKVTGDYEPWVP